MARTIIGTVVSDKADKTVVLKNTVRKTHPLYKKQYSRSTKYIAHDEKNEAQVGDRVEVAETRPISARKRLTLVRVIEKAAITEKDTVEAVSEKEEAKIPEAKVTKENEAAKKRKEAEKKAADEKQEAEK